jgi:hypothetical protein
MHQCRQVGKNERGSPQLSVGNGRNRLRRRLSDGRKGNHEGSGPLRFGVRIRKAPHPIGFVLLIQSEANVFMPVRIAR